MAGMHDDKLFLEQIPFKNTAFGFKKRLEFILRSLRYHVPKYDEPLKVLEVGCGDGEMITLPLAQRGFHVTGVDSDQTSIQTAQSRAAGLDNVRFSLDPIDAFSSREYDAVICSDVLEGCDDYQTFFQSVIDKVNNQGVVIVTVPNGRGPYALQRRVRQMVAKTPLYAVGKKLLRLRRPQVGDNKAGLQGFRYSQLVRLFRSHGMRIEESEGRTFLCGRCFDPLVSLPFMLPLNDWLGSVLPIRLVSGWMFTISRAAQELPNDRAA